MVGSKLKLVDYFKLSLKGFCMGTADVIPGVSGGTIAFLLGIYEDLILAIKSFDLCFVRLLCQLKFKEAFNNVHWKFLGSLVFGILCAIFTLAKLISWLLQNEPVLINAFFFGLILATVPVIARIIKKWTMSEVIVVVLAGVGMFFLTSMVPLQTTEALWFLFLSGALAISAMILPGISGAFILVLLGKYQFILEAVHQRNLLVIGIVGAGVIVGVVTFVRVLSWLFNKYHDMTLAVLTGVVLGSLNKIWPWKQTLRFIEGSHGKQIPVEQINIWPAHFSGEVIIASILVIIGFILTLMLNSSKGKDIQIKV